jgi:hypothetical protein
VVRFRVVRGRLRSGQQIRVTVDRDTHRGLRQLVLDADADATEVVRLLIGRALRDRAPPSRSRPSWTSWG